MEHKEKEEIVGEAMRVQRIDIIRKIIGRVMPVGETHEDEKRLSNLKEMVFVLHELMDEIFEIAYLIDRPEASLCIAANEARKFIAEIQEEIKDSDNF